MFKTEHTARLALYFFKSYNMRIIDMQPDFILDGKQRLPNVDRTLKRLERIIKKKNIKVAF